MFSIVESLGNRTFWQCCHFCSRSFLAPAA